MLRPAGHLVAVTHGAIALFGALVLRPGMPGAGEPAERMGYVATHAGTWTAAWLVPPIAALALLWLSVELRARLDETGKDARLLLALVAVASGVAIEGSACAVAAGALPVLARAEAASAFLAVERAVGLGTTTFGNAGFTLGQILFTSALGRAGAPRGVVTFGWLTAGAGLAFMLAGAIGHAAATTAANGALFVALIAFSALVARWAK